jgi:putative transposase
MIDRSLTLPVTRQAQQLGISRGSVDYLPQPVSPADLAIMRRIDELHMAYPFAGSRMLRDLLGREGVKVGRLHAATLMKRIAIAAIYRRPKHAEAGAGAQDLSLPAARAGGDAAEPGLGHRHYLHPDGAGLRLPRRHRRLVQPAGAGLAGVDHPRGGLLH